MFINWNCMKNIFPIERMELYDNYVSYGIVW